MYLMSVSSLHCIFELWYSFYMPGEPCTLWIEDTAASCSLSLYIEDSDGQVSLYALHK